jgi:hypothetical protein
MLIAAVVPAVAAVAAVGAAVAAPTAFTILGAVRAVAGTVGAVAGIKPLAIAGGAMTARSGLAPSPTARAYSAARVPRRRPGPASGPHSSRPARRRLMRTWVTSLPPRASASTTTC